MIASKKVTLSDCPGARNYGRTISIKGDNTKTVQKLLIAKYFKCNRKKSIFVTDITIHAEKLKDFFKNTRKKSSEADEKWLQRYWKNMEEVLKKTRKKVVQLFPKFQKNFYLELQKFPVFIIQRRGFILERLREYKF